MNDHHDNLREEMQFAHKVKQHLDHGVENLDALTLNKLFATREHALAHQKTRLARFSLATAGGYLINHTLMPQARTLLTVLALAVGATGAYYWTNSQQAEENADIDSALLADDLPINAYLDHGFHAWLKQQQSKQSAEPLQE